jgi:hypothetical protein
VQREASLIVPYDASMVRTLEAVIGRPANAHTWVLTDTSTGTVNGIYASEEIAAASFKKVIQRDPGGKDYVMTVLHPAECDCPEVA